MSSRCRPVADLARQNVDAIETTVADIATNVAAIAAQAAVDAGFATKLVTAEIENAGNITIDPINAAADSTVSITNSDATYKADLTVEGEITSTQGVLNLGTSTVLNAESATAASTLVLAEDTDNGAHTLTVTSPQAITADCTLTLHDGDQTLRRNDEDIADPGDGGAIPIVNGGVCRMTSTGADTRTMAIPTFVGQMITLHHEVDGGSVAVTVASAFNVANNTVWTSDTVDEYAVFIGMRTAAATLAWVIIADDGGALS